MILENWMIVNLKKFGNVCVGEKFVKKHGKENVTEAIKSLGYKNVIVKKRKIDKLITYVFETKIKKRTHTEVKKMQKFNIGDKVEIIDGTLKGKIGTVESYEKNDVGDYTYGIKVPSVYGYLGLTAKQTAQLRLEKAAGKKRGRPAKAKETSKVELLKEVTKEVVEMTEAEPTAAVDEVVEEVDEVVDEPVASPKSAYDQLMEVYDELCKKLTFVELSSFYDIVQKDVEASKYVLEQMYQMSIEQLAKIRKEVR